MYAYLIKIEAGENNNKYYEMKSNDDFTFTAYYGRVGRDPQTMLYDMQKWDRTLKSKVRKGYTDVTHLRAKEAVASTRTDRLQTDSRIIRDIFNYLLASTKQTVDRNYLLPVQGITPQMVQEAQDLLDSLVNLSSAAQWDRFNRVLLDLYKVIPRKMKTVSDHLIPTDNPGTVPNQLISSEQDMLDSLKGQIVVAESDDTEEASVTLFDTLGISVSDIDTDDEILIKRKLGDISNKYHQAVRVVNNKTERRYINWLKTQSDVTQNYLWHGSRTQNWISLLNKGLVLNPTGVVITGKMFGYGLYFAPRAKKSLGYTSLDGSYWASGNDHRGYMGLFAVHTGKMIKYKSSQGHLTFDKVSQMGYNSVMGERGTYLHNDEIIVYTESQCDIKYLVELR